MKLGIICESMKDQYGPVAFESVEKLGLDFIEVCCNFDPDTENFINAVPETKKLLASSPVTIASVGRWNLKANQGGVIVPSELDKNIRLMNAAAEMGCPVFVCGCNYDDSISLYKNYGAAVEYFSKITEEAKKLGIKAAAYNCSWGNFVCHSAAWDVVLGEVEDLWIKYDPSHAFNRHSGYLSYLEELNKWLPRIAHMHIKGATYLNGECVDDSPAGLDQIDWNTVFVLLYKYGYNAGLSIEPHSSVWQGELGEAGVKFTIDFMRKLMLR
ncbi:MAG: sugar phosphate isomerase/epimerase [Clostridia bacterium]|nr:sugar phosphate isomerase/epimerase [Clostridia bacterium]